MPPIPKLSDLQNDNLPEDAAPAESEVPEFIQPASDKFLLNPDSIAVQPSAIEGNGVFTLKACEAGEALMIIAGEAIDGAECERREDEEHNVYIFYNGDDCYIDAAGTEKIRFINHSCHPNAFIHERDGETLYLVARRAIAAGEELTIDYDYEEIYETCQRLNPRCAQTPCPAKTATEQAGENR